MVNAVLLRLRKIVGYDIVAEGFYLRNIPMLFRNQIETIDDALVFRVLFLNIVVQLRLVRQVFTAQKHIADGLVLFKILPPHFSEPYFLQRKPKLPVQPIRPMQEKQLLQQGIAEERALVDADIPAFLERLKNRL